jgi:hypothetical protein
VKHEPPHAQVHWTAGSLRHFWAFPTPEQNPALGVLSTPAHPQVTQAVETVEKVGESSAEPWGFIRQRIAMAKFKPLHENQLVMLPISLQDQLVPETLEHTIHQLVEKHGVKYPHSRLRRGMQGLSIRTGAGSALGKYGFSIVRWAVISQ